MVEIQCFLVKPPGKKWIGGAVAGQVASFINGEWVTISNSSNHWLIPVQKAAGPLSTLLSGFTRLYRNKLRPDISDDHTATRAWIELRERTEHLTKALEQTKNVDSLQAAESIVCAGLIECCDHFNDGYTKKGLNPETVNKFHRNYQALAAHVNSPTNIRSEAYYDHGMWVRSQAREQCPVTRFRSAAERLRTIRVTDENDGKFFLHRICAAAARVAIACEDSGWLYLSHDGIPPEPVLKDKPVDQTEPCFSYWCAICRGLEHPLENVGWNKQAIESANVCELMARMIEQLDENSPQSAKSFLPGVTVDSAARIAKSGENEIKFGRKLKQWEMFSALYKAGADGMSRDDLHHSLWPESGDKSNVDTQKRLLNETLLPLRIEVAADGRGIWRLKTI